MSRDAAAGIDGVPAGVRWREPRPGAPDAGAPAGEAALEQAARALAGGAVLIHPTSTVYGLGGRPDPEIDARIARLKRRETCPLIHLVADRESVPRVLPGVAWTAAAERLADRFWPGPLTLVLDDGSADGIAVRVDAHPAILGLLRRAGGALTSTSLNVSGEPPAASRSEVLEAWRELDDGGPVGWLDAGDLTPSEPSSLVSLRGGAHRTLREGAIPSAEIEAALADSPGARA